MSTLQMSIVLHSDGTTTQTTWWVQDTPGVIDHLTKSFSGKKGDGAYIAATFIYKEDVDLMVTVLNQLKETLCNKPSVNNSSTHWTNDD